MVLVLGERVLVSDGAGSTTVALLDAERAGSGVPPVAVGVLVKVAVLVRTVPWVLVAVVAMRAGMAIWNSWSVAVALM